MSGILAGKLILLSVLVTLVNCNEGEYFWRPWTPGSPPPDALTVQDYRGTSYIVEAYVPSYGLFTGQVFANQYEVNVTVTNGTSNFVIRSSRNLKVLCSQQLDKLAWYPTNYKFLQNELITAVIKPVPGGINDLNQLAYIGRYVDTGLRTVILGSVIKDDYIHYHGTGKTFGQAYYEILVVASKCKPY